jgi:hypothetical protein
VVIAVGLNITVLWCCTSACVIRKTDIVCPCCNLSTAMLMACVATCTISRPGPQVNCDAVVFADWHVFEGLRLHSSAVKLGPRAPPALSIERLRNNLNNSFEHDPNNSLIGQRVKSKPFSVSTPT